MGLGVGRGTRVETCILLPRGVVDGGRAFGTEREGGRELARSESGKDAAGNEPSECAGRVSPGRKGPGATEAARRAWAWRVCACQSCGQAGAGC